MIHLQTKAEYNMIHTLQSSNTNFKNWLKTLWMVILKTSKTWIQWD